MIGTEYDEKQKDEILQKINDILEEHDWGGACKYFVLDIEFEGKFNLKPFSTYSGNKSKFEIHLDE